MSVEIRLDGWTASDAQVGEILPADREQGRSRVEIVRIDPDGTPIGVPTRRRVKAGLPAHDPETDRIRVEDARIADRMAAHDAAHPVVVVSGYDYDPNNPMGWSRAQHDAWVAEQKRIAAMPRELSPREAWGTSDW